MSHFINTVSVSFYCKQIHTLNTILLYQPTANPTFTARHQTIFVDLAVCISCQRDVRESRSFVYLATLLCQYRRVAGPQLNPPCFGLSRFVADNTRLRCLPWSPSTHKLRSRASQTFNTTTPKHHPKPPSHLPDITIGSSQRKRRRKQEEDTKHRVYKRKVR